MSFLLKAKTLFKKNDQTFSFFFFRFLSAFLPLLLVFISRVFLNTDDFSKFQSDYTLVLFGASFFSLGFGVVAQIVGSKFSDKQYELLLVCLILFIIVQLLNILFINYFIKFLPFSNDNLIVRYLWPTYLFITILPSFYLGTKNYFYFFAPGVIFITFLLLGLLLKIQGYSNSMFTLAFIFNLIYFLFEFFKVKSKVVFHSLDLNFIFKILIDQFIPFYTGIVGIKNFPYYVILFFGASIFGEIKLLISVFNLANFFISSKVLLISNSILSSKEKIFLKLDYKNIHTVIFKLNIFMFFSLMFFSCFFPSYFYFSDLFPYTLFNIGMNLLLLNNQIYFALGQSRLRVLTDIIAVSSILFIFFIINFLSFKISSSFVLFSLVLVIFLVNIFSTINKKKVDYF